jgi:nitrite reductase/ring-hydroxylating ferredoxin subunit
MIKHPVARLADLPPGSRQLVHIGKVEIGVFNVDGEIHAYRNICPHAGAPVCRGKVSGTTLPSLVYEYSYGRDGCILRCPWHGWEFDLKTGEHLVDTGTKLKKFSVERAVDAASENLERLPVERDGDFVYVVIPGGPLGP